MDEEEQRKKECITTVVVTLAALVNLDEEAKSRFLSDVERYVTIISKMQRRASLCLLQHMTRAASEEVPVPDLYGASDTFWKDLLRQGEGSSLTEEITETVNALHAFVGEVPSWEGLPAMDQVVAYAARTLKTVVKNNTWVPLIPRLCRLTKTLVQSYRSKRGAVPPNFTFKLMNAVRSGRVEDVWPQWALQYVSEVRLRLGLDDSRYLDDHFGDPKGGASFDTLFRFNVWMSRELQRLGARGIVLSPVMQVRRHCVRFDKRILAALASKYLGHRCTETLQDIMPLFSTRKMPSLQGMEFGLSLCTDGIRACLQFTRQLSSEEAHAREDAQDRRKKVKVLKQQRKCALAEEKMAMARLKEARGSLKAAKQSAGRRTGAAADPDVVNALQGVSVAEAVLQEARSAKEQVCLEIQDVKNSLQAAVLERCSNPSASTGPVIGGDPGRSNIMVSALVDSKSTWTLSRRQYYQESGTWRMDLKQRRRTKCLKDGWRSLGDDDASLRTHDPRKVFHYLFQYQTMQDQWWDVALKKATSRDSYQRFKGKRGVLDKYFSKVLKSVGAEHPGTTPCFAYGQAVMTMKPTGKGELSVPTTTAYMSAKKIFGARNTLLVDEFHTTKFGWHGQEMQSVYRKNDGTKNVTVNKQLAEVFQTRNNRRQHRAVRGLRHCPVSRSYLSRDLYAARSIGMLGVLTLRGEQYPETFRH